MPPHGVKPTGRQESLRLVAEMSPRRTPQTAKSSRKVGEEHCRWPGQEKSWTTPRRRPVDKERFSENVQAADNKRKLKPQSLFTPPRHYREEVWPKATQAALSPINVNGPLSGKEGAHGRARAGVPDNSPAERVLASKGDLVPSLTASGKRVQFGSRPTNLKCKELFQADSDSDQVDNQKTLVWNNPTYCEEGSWNETASNCRGADSLGADDDSTSLTLASKRDKTSTADGLSERKETVSLVEADLEAEIRRNIEEEIENEIRILSERLAELHARQGVRQTDRDHCPDVALSCPQTPILSARQEHTPERLHFLQDFVTETKESPVQESSMQGSATHVTEEGSQAAESSICKHRKSRTVSAKFLNWNKEAGGNAVKFEDRKPIPKNSVMSGHTGASPQLHRRGMSLGGATLTTKRREASAHRPYPRASSKPAERNDSPAAESRTPPAHVEQEERTPDVENAGSRALGSCSNPGTPAEPGRVQKLTDQLQEEGSSKAPIQSAALSAWLSLGTNKRFDWIKTLRSGGEGTNAKQGLSAAFKVEDQDESSMNVAEVKPRLLAGNVSPVSPLLPEKTIAEGPKSAGSRIVPSRYGSLLVMGADVQRDKGVDMSRNSNCKVRRDDSVTKPGVHNSRPARSASVPAKPLKNENMKCRPALSGDAEVVAAKLTPKRSLVRCGGQHNSLLQGRVSATRPPFSTGKKTLGRHTKGESIEQNNWGGGVGEAGSSPNPTSDLLAKFEQLAIKKRNIGRSGAQARGPNADIPGTSRRHREGAEASSPADAPSLPVQRVDVLKTPSAFSLQRTGSRVHATPEDFRGGSDLRTGADHGIQSVVEEFWTPSVLLSPPPAPGSSARKDLLPVVTELRSHLNSSPGLKKYSELLRDLDSLDVERKGLPRIATRSFVGISPRDSGCVKRANDRSKGHPFGSQPDSLDLSHLNVKDLEQSLETLAAQFPTSYSSSEVEVVPAVEGSRAAETIQGPLVGCLETYAQEGRWENGAVMQQLSKDILKTCVKGNGAGRKPADFKQQTDVTEVSELENLWLLVEKLDKERRDSVYEMLSRQLAKIQQEQT